MFDAISLPRVIASKRTKATASLNTCAMNNGISTFTTVVSHHQLHDLPIFHVPFPLLFIPASAPTLF